MSSRNWKSMALVLAGLSATLGAAPARAQALPVEPGTALGTGSASAATGESGASDLSLLSREAMKIRDPFQQPVLHAEEKVEKPALESYPVESFKLIGVQSGPRHMRAMLKDPNGNSHIVSERMRIGIKQGIVTAITPERMKVRERITNLLGEAEYFDTELYLDGKGNGKGGAGKGGMVQVIPHIERNTPAAPSLTSLGTPMGAAAFGSPTDAKAVAAPAAPPAASQPASQPASPASQPAAQSATTTMTLPSGPSVPQLAPMSDKLPGWKP